MTGTYNEKRLSVRANKDHTNKDHADEKSAPSALRCGMYELCGSAVCAVLLTLAGWGGMILVDHLLALISF